MLNPRRPSLLNTKPIPPPQELYLEAKEADERERLLLSLGYATGGSNVGATLQFALSPDVRAQVRCTRDRFGPAGAALLA